MADIRKATRTRVEWGIEIPRADGLGLVFISQDDLVRLAEQERYDVHFSGALTLSVVAGRALEAAGLAERETRGGYHRTQKLCELLNEWGW